MSKVVINELTLTNIGAAIREKTGKNDLIAPGDMPAEIRAIESGGGGGVEVEPIVLTGKQSYGCAGPMAAQYMGLFGDTVTTNKVTDTDYMFYNSTARKIPFDINYDNSTSRTMSSMFSGAEKLEEIPKLNNACPSGISSLMNRCARVRYLPENFGVDWNWTKMNTSSAVLSMVFAYCYSLRSIPEIFLKHCYGNSSTSTYSTFYYNGLINCYTLDEIRGMPVQQSTLTSNGFNSTVSYCYRLKECIFGTNEDGTPKTANWKSQTINFDTYTGWARNTTDITNYNSGITADKQVKDDATYQALKNDPDWFTLSVNYSRYNHDSAVNTINSLPDCSASGGTNTIKFRGIAGNLTDGGAINTLTEEEIAVAAAKGWTVTLS